MYLYLLSWLLQGEGQRLLAAAAPVTRQLLPHYDLGALLAVFSLHFPKDGRDSMAGLNVTNRGRPQEPGSWPTTSSNSNSRSSSRSTRNSSNSNSSSNSSSSSSNRILGLLEPLCSQVLQQDLSSLSIEEKQLLAATLRVLHILPSAQPALSARQLLQQLDPRQAQQQQQQQQQKGRAGGGTGSSGAQFQSMKLLWRELGRSGFSLEEVAQLVGKHGHTMDLYGLGYLHYKVGSGFRVYGSGIYFQGSGLRAL
jgi:hypothetical protein